MRVASSDKTSWKLGCIRNIRVRKLQQEVSFKLDDSRGNVVTIDLTKKEVQRLAKALAKLS